MLAVSAPNPACVLLSALESVMDADSARIVLRILPVVLASGAGTSHRENHLLRQAGALLRDAAREQNSPPPPP